VVSKLVFFLFDMANINFPLQCPHLTNYEIWCIHVKAGGRAKGAEKGSESIHNQPLMSR
jgi:hypothetical protein